MDEVRYVSAVIDGEAVTFPKPQLTELAVLDIVKVTHPDWMEIELLNAKGKRNGFLFRKLTD